MIRSLLRPTAEPVCSSNIRPVALEFSYSHRDANSHSGGTLLYYARHPVQQLQSRSLAGVITRIRRGNTVRMKDHSEKLSSAIGISPCNLKINGNFSSLGIVK
jgi:hypothetical protein